MLKPLRDMILVKPRPQETKTAGGLFIPNAKLEANNNAELVIADVIAVGPGYYTQNGVFVEQDVKVGDVVAYGGLNYSGTKVDGDDNVDYRLLRHVDVIMVFLDKK